MKSGIKISDLLEGPAISTQVGLGVFYDTGYNRFGEISPFNEFLITDLLDQADPESFDRIESAVFRKDVACCGAYVSAVTGVKFDGEWICLMITSGKSGRHLKHIEIFDLSRFEKMLDYILSKIPLSAKLCPETPVGNLESMVYFEPDYISAGDFIVKKG